MLIIYPIQFAGRRCPFANMLPLEHEGELSGENEPAAMDKLTVNQQFLVATAWVDNRLDPAEADMIRQVLGKQGISDSDIDQVLNWPAPSVASLISKLPGDQAREEVIRDVLRMCFSDGVLEFEEFDLIERVAGQLGLNEETLERIRSEVSGE